MKFGKIANVKILDAAITTATGATFEPWDLGKTFFAHGTTSTGSGAATILIEGSNEDTPTVWFTVATLTLASLAVTASCDAKYDVNPWKSIRARVTALSGTNSAVTVWMAT